MKRLFLTLFALILMFAANAMASQTRVFVGEFNAVGVQNRDELKNMLQTLLSSRLNSDKILAVGSSAEADVLVSGTYVVIGKIYSIDAVARTTGGRTLTRTFIQGDAGEELIPVVGKLAERLSVELSRVAPAASAPSATAVAPIASVATKNDIIRNVPASLKASGSEFIKPQESGMTTAGSWLSKRLDGASNLMATGRKTADGGRELLLAEDRKITLYRLGDEMKLISQEELGNGYNIIGLDTLETVDGNLDIYLTIIRSSELSSQVWQVKGDKLVKIADSLPWFFRSFGLGGGSKKLYVQSMSRDADFFGDVYEAYRKGSKIITGKTIKLPSKANLYTFNQFRDSDNKTMTVVLNKDDYLVIYGPDMNEMWRSNEKFGGSELYFQKDDADNMRVTGDKYRWIYLAQRIQVTAKNDIMVGKNGGFWVLGNARSYSKGAVHCLIWNGSSLEEKWRTKETQNYMPDYYYDEVRNELMMLQIVQRPGMLTNGASSLAIKKVE